MSVSDDDLQRIADNLAAFALAEFGLDMIAIYVHSGSSGIVVGATAKQSEKLDTLTLKMVEAMSASGRSVFGGREVRSEVHVPDGAGGHHVVNTLNNEEKGKS